MSVLDARVHNAGKHPSLATLHKVSRYLWMASVRRRKRDTMPLRKLRPQNVRRQATEASTLGNSKVNKICPVSEFLGTSKNARKTHSNMD